VRTKSWNSEMNFYFIVNARLPDVLESPGDIMNLKEKAKKMKREVPAIFLALKNKETPLLAKIIAAVAVGYALPIVLIWLILIWIIVKTIWV